MRIVIFTCIVTLCGCVTKSKLNNDTEGKMAIEDSLKYEIRDLGQIERDLYDYYMDTEKYLKDKHDICDEEINSYMQLLIDDGTIDPPYIIINEGAELNYKTLTYQEYKKYIKNVKLDSTKQLRLNYN